MAGDRRRRPAFVLKVSPPWPDTAGEAAALTTWAQRGREPHRMIVPERVDLDRRTMLLPRLDHARSLEDHPDIDEAVTIIAEVLASISGIAAPAGIPRVADQLVEIEDRLDQSTGMIPHLIDRARARLAELSTWLSGPNAPQSLLHNDCHFLNVLRDPREGEPEWTGIDPLPVAGPPEWELIPLLRNRWAAAVATGRPERALLRRVDVVSRSSAWTATWSAPARRSPRCSTSSARWTPTTCTTPRTRSWPPGSHHRP